MQIGEIIRKSYNFLSDPVKRFDYLSVMGLHKHLSDEEFLEKMYEVHMKKKLNLKNPKTFNEKLQWLKLYDRNPEYTVMADKYCVKKYVEEKIGKEHIIPLLGVWDKVEDIEFDKLPNEFVIKCTHDSASFIICRNKKFFDVKAAKSKLKRKIKRNFFWNGREWPYKNIKPRIIAEKYMVENIETKELTDYKFFCFNGEPKIMYIGHDIADQPTCDFYDMDFKKINLTIRDPSSNKVIEKPVFFDKMKEYASILSQNIPHVRVDFYYIEGTIYFGEMTFFHNGGMVNFNPEIWDRILGDWLQLPKNKNI